MWNTRLTTAVPKKYKDSAILMRWNEKILKPDSVFRYTTYYGLFNPDQLELIASEPAKLAEFKISKDTIKQIEKSLLTWKAKINQKTTVKIGYIINDDKSGKPKAKYLGGNIGLEGSIYVSPNSDRNYFMEIFSNRKLINTMWEDVNVTTEEKESDGRFTLGTKSGNTLLFGYPYAYPASHFVVTVDGKYASNKNNLADTITYLKGKNKLGLTANGSVCDETEFLFNDIIIKQKLIPADAELNEISLNPSEFWIKNQNSFVPVDNSQYPINIGKRTFYKIEYEIINPTGIEIKNIGISLLLDVMSNGKDDVSLYAGSQKIPLNTNYSGNGMPKVLSDSSGKMNNFILKTPDNKNVSPDELTVGFYEYLNSIIYNTSTKPKEYGEDISVLLKWNKNNLKPKTNRTMSVYVGNTNDTIEHVYNNLKEFKNISVFFASGKADIPDNEINKILKIIKSNLYECILIEGFCDNQGDDKSNYILASKRANDVKQHLIKSGISEKKILIKISGEFNANKKVETNTKDRRVDVTLLKNND